MQVPHGVDGELARLQAENQKLRRINDVLVRRVEQSMNSQGTSFSVFETAILLEEQVRQRTQQLETALQDLQETNRLLSASKEQADAGNRSKSAFLAMMSHEIRTPLNGILGLGEMLAITQLDPHQKELLDSLVGSAEMLLSLLNDVLDASRIEADKLQLAPTNVELRPLLDHVRQLFDNACIQKGLRLRMGVANDVPTAVHVDGVRLRQVLVNLVGNGVKFTDRGEVFVEVRTGERPEELVFEVGDTGIGMDADCLSRLFVPFSQADHTTARRYGGSGLGLWICKRLARLLGGDLVAASEPGVGTRIRFTLRAPPAAIPQQESATEPLPRVSATVLVVDDNAVNLRVASSMLTRLGCTTASASSGAEALAMFQSGSFDLVLMDVQMPEMDGFEATRRLRAMAGPACPPIVALTAIARNGDEQRCMEAGMDGYMCKPIRIRDLARGIARYLPPERVTSP